MNKTRSPQSLLLPLSIVVLGTLLILMVIARPQNPQAATLQQNETYTDPPTLTPYEDPTETEDDDEDPTETETDTPTETEEGDEEPTETEEDGQEEATEEPTETAEPTEEGEPTETREASTSTPSNTPIPKNDIRDCFIDETVVIEPRMNEELAPPNTPLLLFFDGRVVGGGTSDRNGFYSLRLTIGEEEAGTLIDAEDAVPLEHPVEIRVRGTRELVHELTCNLWDATPTPTIPVIPTRQDM